MTNYPRVFTVYPQATIAYDMTRHDAPQIPTRHAGEYCGRLPDIDLPRPGDRVYSGRFSFVIGDDGRAVVRHVNPY